MTRAELQQLTRDRLRDAKILLAGRRWAGAYYLAGYAVECALKSCIIAHLMRTDQFPEKRYSEQCWTHSLEQLVTLAGLKADLDAAKTGDPDLKVNWDTVKDWHEATRYARQTKAKAVALYKAITDTKHGVLRWIRYRW
jgi:hypothetical protein